MSDTFNVRISNQPANGPWDSKALLSFGADGATIHLDPSKPEKLQLRQVQLAGRKLDGQGIPELALTGDDWSLARQWAFAQGLSSPKRDPESLSWAASSEAELAELNARRHCAEWIRAVSNGTPEEIGPMMLASRAADFIHALAPEAVRYSFRVGEELEEQGFLGVYNVGRGSERPPVMLELDYNPTGNDDEPFAAALVGKGITFDSGGYSLKPTGNMLGMKGDMGGAAQITGALALAILRGLKVRVKLILCCAENLVSGSAYKLGDIIEYRNGVKVEITNTDAEGRLALADGLILAGDSGAPLIIDAATLTGAAKIAVGRDFNSIMSMDGDLLHQVLEFAKDEREGLWPLPLERFHRNQCPSAYADTANAGGRFGGASSAAGFLSRFVPNPEQGWIHLDMSGAFLADGDTLWAKGATAMGMCTIARTLLEKTR